jgi:tripartite-type tricarboxylate transporter receptor subunit TctC
VARLAAPYLNKKWGVPVSVVNKPGGNSLPATTELYSAAPNGYTVLADIDACSSMLGAVIKDLPFKIMDRTFISILCYAPMVFIIPSTSPHKTLNEVVAEIKKDPENFTWCSLGGSGAQDYFFRQLFKVIGVDVNKTKPVMVKGGAQTTAMVAGGHVKMGCTTVASAGATAKAGAIKMVGISEKRNPEFPDVPTTAELGYPSVNYVFWVGFSGPPKLSSHMVMTWEKALQELLRDSEFTSRLNNAGFYPFYLDSQGMREYVRKQMEEVTELFISKKQ